MLDLKNIAEEMTSSALGESLFQLRVKHEIVFTDEGQSITARNIPHCKVNSRHEERNIPRFSPVVCVLIGFGIILVERTDHVSITYHLHSFP